MYIVKLPDKVCVSHMKPVGENKTVLQLKQFAEVLLTGLTFKKILKKVTVNFYIVSVCQTSYWCLLSQFLEKTYNLKLKACFKVSH